jgi:hypothetical protein
VDRHFRNAGAKIEKRSARRCATSSGVADHEGVGDVLEEDQTENDVLVLSGVHLPAQLVGGFPQRCFGSRSWGVRATFVVAE